MKIHKLASQLVFAIVLAAPGSTFGGIIESGTLNIIDDPGNPSDGLRFLDMFYGDGKTLAAALISAQVDFSNARLATPSEFDDLFAASAIIYNSTSTASDAFTPNPGGASLEFLSFSTNHDSGVLRDQLGLTSLHATQIWSDPDGLFGPINFGTRDVIVLFPGAAALVQNTALPADSDFGWLLVSEAPPPPAPVPEPSSLMLVCMGVVGLLGYGYRRKRKQAA